MTATTSGFTIDRVAIVDDDPSARLGYKPAIEDMDVEAVLEAGPLMLLQPYVQSLSTRVNAVFCDFHLKKKDYARFNGDELAAALYKQRIPAVLCTSYSDWEQSLLRTHRRFIPKIIEYAAAEPETIMEIFETCISEFDGKYEDVRRPWRTLVRVEEIIEDQDYLYVVVPGWSAIQKIRVQYDSIPTDLLSKMQNGLERLHAKVNIGAESDEDLYFDWELTS